MESLKPVLVYKFWILFGIVLLLALAGFFPVMGNYTQEIDERTQMLASALNVQTGLNVPNDQWAVELAKLIEEQRERIREAHERLWNEQTVLMRWPQQIRDQMARVPYFSKPENENEILWVPDFYVNEYEEEIERVWRLVDPIEATGSKGRISFLKLRVPQASTAGWRRTQPPSWIKMWEVQEDIWLVTELLQAIARVNETTTFIKDSHIREIEKIVLQGGKRSSSQSRLAAQKTASRDVTEEDKEQDEMDKMGGDAEESDDTQDEDGMDGQDGMAGGGLGDEQRVSIFGGGPRVRQQQQESAEKVDFDPANLFGGASAARYVDDDDDLPYRTRGFYLVVVMDHRRIPELLIELTNSRYPVEILRVQLAARNTEETGSTGPTRPAARRGHRFDVRGDRGELDPGRLGDEKLRNIAAAQSATADENMAKVAIAGLMTIYKPPETDEKEPGTGTSPSTPGQPVADAASQETPTKSDTAPDAGQAATSATGEIDTSQAAQAPTDSKPATADPKSNNGSP